jgi:hypothetical protein
MLKNALAGILLPILLQSQAATQHGPKPTDVDSVARVEIIAFESKGRFLGPPNVSIFESADHENLASRFRDGVATGIPYGVYRIEARLPAYFSDVRYLRVYQAKVTVVLGLRFGEELPQVPPSLGGRITGLSAPLGRIFVKLIGVYENVAVESEISSDGSFELGGLSPGRFLLLVVGEKGVVASRALTIPYTGPPLEIEVKDDHP